MTNFAREYDWPPVRGAPPCRPRPPVAEHWVWLVLCTIVIAASFSLQVRGTEQVVPSFAPDLALPSLCSFRSLLGINCPGCGLTRSFIYLAHGDWQASWEMHRLGWLFALIVISQIPYRIYRLYRPRRIRAIRRIFHLFACSLAGLFLANWLLGLLLAN